MLPPGLQYKVACAHSAHGHKLTAGSWLCNADGQQDTDCPWCICTSNGWHACKAWSYSPTHNAAEKWSTSQTSITHWGASSQLCSAAAAADSTGSAGLFSHWCHPLKSLFVLMGWSNTDHVDGGQTVLFTNAADVTGTKTARHKIFMSRHMARSSSSFSVIIWKDGKSNLPKQGNGVSHTPPVEPLRSRTRLVRTWWISCTKGISMHIMLQ